MGSHLFIFHFISCALDIIYRTSLPRSMSRSFNQIRYIFIYSIGSWILSVAGGSSWVRDQTMPQQWPKLLHSNARSLTPCAIRKLPLYFSITYSSGSFIAIRFTRKSFMHFELIFVHGLKCGSSFILLHVNSHLSQQNLLKRLSFLNWVVLDPLSNINWTCRLWFISELSIPFLWSICFYARTIQFWWR